MHYTIQILKRQNRVVVLVVRESEVQRRKEVYRY